MIGARGPTALAGVVTQKFEGRRGRSRPGRASQQPPPRKPALPGPAQKDPVWHTRRLTSVAIRARIGPVERGHGALLL